MRHRRLLLLATAVLAISACSLYSGGSDHTPHLTEPDAAISDHDGGCDPVGDGGSGGAYPDGGIYDNDAGSWGYPDAGTFGNDGGGYLPDAYLPDAH